MAAKNIHSKWPPKLTYETFWPPKMSKLYIWLHIFILLDNTDILMYRSTKSGWLWPLTYFFFNRVRYPYRILKVKKRRSRWRSSDFIDQCITLMFLSRRNNTSTWFWSFWFFKVNVKVKVQQRQPIDLISTAFFNVIFFAEIVEWQLVLTYFRIQPTLKGGHIIC